MLAAAGSPSGAQLGPAVPLRHVRGLDGLRALAVLAVMAVHFRLPGAGAGVIGLDVFFVLSGFLITRIARERMAGPGGLELRWFYRRRAERIVPALFFLVLVLTAVTLAWPSAMPWRQRHFLREAAAAAAFFTPFAALYPRAMPFAHTWSLGIEAWFYLLWPPVLLLCRRRAGALRAAAAAIGLGAIGLATARYHEIATMQPLPHAFHLVAHWRVDSLVIGCLLGLFVHRLPAAGRWRDRLGGIALVLLLALLASGDFLRAVRWQCTAGALCTALLVASLAWSDRSWMAAVLEWRPLRWLGEISYGTYLWHLPLSLLLRKWMAGGALRAAAMFAASLAAGALSYHLVERRFMDARSSDPSKRPRASTPVP